MAILDIFKRKESITESDIQAIFQRSLAESLKVINLAGIETSPYNLGVSGSSIMGLTAVWSCVKLLDDTFAGLPFHVYDSTDGKTVKLNHPLAKLFNVSPVEGIKAFDWRSLAMSKILLHGNFYAYIERDKSYRPIRLTPILSEVKVDIIKGEIVYIFPKSKNSKEMNKVPYWDMLHIKGYSEDGITGKSVIQAHRDSFGIGLSAQKASKDFYEKGAKLDGFLSTDQVLREDTYKKLKDSWNERKQDRTPVLDAGMKFHTVKLTPQDAQYIQTQQFNELAVARIFRVPPHMIGIMDRATWNNVELLGIEFAKFTMLPYCINWEQEINQKLLTEAEQEKGVYVKFNIEGLMRADMKTRFESYQLAIQNGLKSINECRELEDLNPIEGGDKHYIQGNNMVDINHQESESDNNKQDETGNRD